MSSTEAVASDAHIETVRARRYLGQLLGHARSIGDRHRRGGFGHLTRHGGEIGISATGTDTDAELVLDPWGRCTATADATALHLHVDAATPEDLHRIQDVLIRDLERFSRRDPLTIAWSPSRTGSGSPGGSRPTPSGGDGGTRRRRPGAAALTAVGAVVVVGIAVAAHLGVFAAVLTAPAWLGVGGVAVALLAVKLALVAAGGWRLHHRYRGPSRSSQ